MGELNPEIRESLNEFVRDLAELTARTGIKVGDLLPGVGAYLDTVVGDHAVGKNLVYNEEEAVYEYEDVLNLEAEVQAYEPSV